MKKRPHYALFLFAFCWSSIIMAQENPGSIYGNWYQTRNGWADTRDSSFDLIIYESDSVHFKQTLFVSPCQFRFDGRVIGDTIFHTSDLYCLENQSEGFRFSRTNVDTFVIDKVAENYLKLTHLNTNKTREYQKKIVFEDLLNLLKSQTWSNNINSLNPYGMRLERHLNNKFLEISDSTQSTWTFQDGGILQIDYGQVQQQWKWKFSRDSILQLQGLSGETKRYKMENIQPWRMSLKTIQKAREKSVFTALKGYYGNKYVKGSQHVSIVLNENQTYSLTRTALENGGLCKSQGRFEVDNNIITFHPVKYRVAYIDAASGRIETVDKFATVDLKFNLKLLSDKGANYFDYERKDGTTLKLRKK